MIESALMTLLTPEGRAMTKVSTALFRPHAQHCCDTFGLSRLPSSTHTKFNAFAFTHGAPGQATSSQAPYRAQVVVLTGWHHVVCLLTLQKLLHEAAASVHGY
jgi:hypothetical protein